MKRIIDETRKFDNINTVGFDITDKYPIVVLFVYSLGLTF